MITIKRLAATVLALLAPLAALVGSLALRNQVPDPLPVHWNIHNQVDGTATVHGFVLATVLIALALAIGAGAAVWLGHSPVAGRMLAALLSFGAWVPAVIALVTLLISRGAAVATEVTMPWYAPVGLIVVPLAFGVATAALLPSRWQHTRAPRPVPDTPVTIAPDERVVWIGHTHSPVMRVLAWVAAVAGVVLLILQPSIAIPVLVASVAFTMTSELAVRVDGRGVHTLWGPFGWPRPRIPLDEIVAARAERIEPAAWGGWGYRVSPRGVAAVVRRGPGIVIERDGKAPYAVTVADASAGADVLNALVQRAHR